MRPYVSLGTACSPVKRAWELFHHSQMATCCEHISSTLRKLVKAWQDKEEGKKRNCVTYLLTLLFLLEYTGENDTAFTLSKRSDLVENDAVHMPGRQMDVCHVSVVFCGFPRFPRPWPEKELRNVGVCKSNMPWAAGMDVIVFESPRLCVYMATNHPVLSEFSALENVSEKLRFCCTLFLYKWEAS